MTPIERLQMAMTHVPNWVADQIQQAITELTAGEGSAVGVHRAIGPEAPSSAPSPVPPCATCGQQLVAKCPVCQSEEKFYCTAPSNSVDLLLCVENSVGRFTLQGRGVKLRLRFGTNEKDERGEYMTKTREIMLSWNQVVDVKADVDAVLMAYCRRFAQDIQDEVALAKKPGKP